MLPPFIEMGQLESHAISPIDPRWRASHSIIMSSSDHPPREKKLKLLLEREAEESEIQRHKWFESERAGKDVGYGYARIDWSIKHRKEWICRNVQERGR
jgi:hypothetical protein